MYSTSAQFITLKGKQFIDASGQPFYPVVCNYGINFYCNNCTGSGSYPEDVGYTYGNFDPADVDLGPGTTTLNGAPTFGDGLGYMKAAFAKMKAMGFNTVRLMGWSPSIAFLNDPCNPTPPGDQSLDGSYCFKWNNLSAQITCEAGIGIPLIYAKPYISDYNLNNVAMPKIKAAMQAANDAGLKVLLDCLFIHDFSGNDDMASSSNDMLVAIAASINSDAGGHPELLAYDLYNEPHWNIWDNGINRNTTVKHKICQYTSMWYDNIKAVDPNHLITNGDVGPWDVFDWDPAVLKLDFNCYHPYPQWFCTAFDGYNEDNATSRYQTWLYWLNNNTPMPWIITETGVGATASSSTGFNAAAKTWGTYADQSAWAIQSQELVINNGGSGYGWWDFQGSVDGGEAGLLKRGQPTSLGGGNYSYGTTYDKPVVADGFSTHVVTHGTAQVARPSNYYNAWDNGCTSCFTWSGKVVDQFGNPIQDAVITGANNAFENLGVVDPINQFSITTFSHADGTFSLIAPVPSPIIPVGTFVYDYGKFDQIEVSAAGASIFQWGRPTDFAGNPITGAPSCSDCSCTGSATVCNLITLSLPNGGFNNTAVNLDINSGNSSSTSPATATARHMLDCTEILVESDGFADFHASSLVDLQSVFALFDGSTVSFTSTLEKGSYTHIYCTPVDFDCEPIETLAYLHGPKVNANSNDTSTMPFGKDITVNYVLPSGNIKLMPNPTENYFYLLAHSDSATGNVEITDASGHSVYTGKLLMAGQTLFNTSGFAPGLYTVHVTSSSESQNFKLIISR